MKTFDLRETIMYFSLLQLTNHFKKINPGDTVEILCSDKNTVCETFYESIKIGRIKIAAGHRSHKELLTPDP